MANFRELRIRRRSAGVSLADPVVPAVVVGGTLNGLGVVRSLAAGHMPIYLVETSRLCTGGWSRHGNLVRAPSLEGTALIDSLVELRVRLAQRPVLILTSDPCVEAVSAHREKIEPLYRISLPSADVVHTLADKSAFQTLAESRGFPVPRGLAIRDETDLDRLRELSHPVVIKPADKMLVLSGRVERTARARTISESRAAAEHMLQRARPLVAQEWIEGPDSEIYFTLFSCDRDGDFIGLFCGRKIVSSPPQTGSTAICVAAPEAAEELGAETRRFVGAVHYRGLGGLEFKRDIRTGRFAIIEPTVGRTDWQEEIATLCGINLPLLTYSAEVDGRVPSPISGVAPLPMPSPARAVAWRASLEHDVPGTMTARGMRLIDGYFRWSDPLPAVYYYIYERGALRLWRRTRTISQRRAARKAPSCPKPERK